MIPQRCVCVGARQHQQRTSGPRPEDTAAKTREEDTPAAAKVEGTMHKRTRARWYLLGLVCWLAQATSSSAQRLDLVAGNLIQFNDNGAWCWYQDERAVIDTSTNKLIVGSVACPSGAGGPSRSGLVESVILDLETRQPKRYILMTAGCDDHNAPAFLVFPDGRYLAMYAKHYDTVSRYRIFSGSEWELERQFDWASIPGGTDFYTTYSNLFSLPAEGKIYNFVRCYARSPNMMVSSDWASSWTYGGLLTQPDVNIGYVNGYFKYTSNNYDRIDFVCTEHHPRDYNTSIYHGYISGGRSFDSFGAVKDSLITDKRAPRPADFTLVFAANTLVNHARMTRCWTIDVQRYSDGTIATIFKARADDNERDHRFFYARFDGTKWSWTYLGKAGPKLYESEQDYVGLGALHPHDPNTLYLSTPFDPRDDADLGKHEIFRGTTADHGATWTWEPITMLSTRDNLRPIVAAWRPGHTALLWFRGSYYSAGRFDAAVVGILETPDEHQTPMQYVDASEANTTLANGAPLPVTGPDPNPGPADGRWHWRTGFGNSGSVLASAETEGEDAPLLKTVLRLPEPGTYDMWVNFWANPNADWRIKAGWSPQQLQLFRAMACKQVDRNAHREPLTYTGAGNTFLYQAYLGRIEVTDRLDTAVYVDDEPIPPGTQGPLAGNTVRTWYDGISFARVECLTDVARSPLASLPSAPLRNFPNPFNTRTSIEFGLPSAGSVRIVIYDLLGKEVERLLERWMPAGVHRVSWEGTNYPSGLYFCRISTAKTSQTIKITLLR
ncbi:MAG: T9SS type A sorting domain-containing protein [candidate division KSB1 bacterium]|nr:T9SS type A sorting domain-containing protein [candidate division KSB1 bacterium]